MDFHREKYKKQIREKDRVKSKVSFSRPCTNAFVNTVKTRIMLLIAM